MRFRVLSLLAILFLLLPLSAARGWTYTPAWCPVGPFPDVSTGEWCPWIQAFSAEQISTGCEQGAYCPDGPVSRDTAALVLERTMRGTNGWSPSQGWYSRTVLVSAVPFNPVASGNALRSAREAITDAAYGRQWLIKLEPGVYDLGSTTLTLPAWVDLEGSGQGITRILGQPQVGQPILAMAEATALSALTLGPAPLNRIAIAADGGGVTQARRLEQVTILAQGDAVTCTGGRLEIREATVGTGGGTTNRAVAATDCQLTIENSLLSAQGGQTARALDVDGSATVRRSRLTAALGSSVSVAIRASNGDLSLDDVDARGNRGVAAGQPQALHLLSASAKVRNSRLSTDDANGLTLGADASSEAEVVDSWLAKGVVSTTDDEAVSLIQTEVDQISYNGTLRCFAVYDQTFTNAGAIDDCP